MILEVITVSEEKIVERAIELLAKHKQLIFKLEKCEVRRRYNFELEIIVSDLTLTGFNIQTNIIISEDVFKELRTDDEPKNICFNDIIALRVAKILFDWHKAQEQKQLADATNNLCGNATLTIDSSKSNPHICLSPSLKPNIHIDGVDALKQKIKDLEDNNKKLTDEIDDLKVILRKKRIL